MIFDIATLYSWHQSYYISPHTDYIWKHIHCISVITPRLSIIQCYCMYGNTATICMTTYELHMASRPLFMISHNVMISHPMYSCHQPQDTCHHMHWFWTITYSVLTVPLYQTKPQYLWCHIYFRHDITHPVSDIASTVSLSSKPDITHTVFMIWHLLYLWHIIHCIWYLTHDLWHHNTLSITSVYYISYQTDYIWQHFHCISVITPRLSVI